MEASTPSSQKYGPADQPLQIGPFTMWDQPLPS
jgi:hypothetical protein